jgi:exopolyphosphatase/guanosine-5'-triphosphate,3'-diphosphate pyrophosphatase
VSEQRLAVIDLGSNSFRLVVFTWTEGEPHGWWKRSDEIHEAVRVGAGLDAAGELQPEPMERALETIELYAHFCRATGITDIRPVATSAIREASNREDFLKRARKRSGLEIEVLSPEEEARYGYLAAVNSTTLDDGVSLDLGGGSMQLVHVEDRVARDERSWKLGAVRMTERFLTEDNAKRKQLKALRNHVREELAQAGWLADAGADGQRMAGIGGTVRNLAAAAELASDLPSFSVQGFHIRRTVLDDLVEQFADLSPAERGKVPGIKPERGDLILAGSVVIQTVMDVGGFDSLEATEAGLREGVFYSSLLAGREPPLFDNVRHDAVCNLAAQYHADFVHSEHVARLSLQIWDALAAEGIHPGDPRERDLLWAAAMLHDIGMTVDYDDHHKHSRYLILNAGLPGHSPRETALIGQMARYHRKGSPSLGPFASLARDGDEALLTRGSALLRLSEQLERSRDQAVREADVDVQNGCVELSLVAEVDVSVARWAAQRQGELFEKAFGKSLSVVDA